MEFDELIGQQNGLTFQRVVRKWARECPEAVRLGIRKEVSKATYWRASSCFKQVQSLGLVCQQGGEVRGGSRCSYKGEDVSEVKMCKGSMFKGSRHSKMVLRQPSLGTNGRGVFDLPPELTDY